MKRLFKLSKMRLDAYFTSSDIVIPGVAVIGFFAFMYTIKPLEIVSSYLISAVFIFFLGVFIAAQQNGKENETAEQVLLFHSENTLEYYLSRELFLAGVVLFFALILGLYPAASNLVNGGDMFTEKLLTTDVVGGTFLIFANGILGTSMGDFFHPRAIGNRRSGLLAIVLFTVLTITKAGLVQKYSWTSFVLWIVPPALKGYEVFKGASHIDLLNAFALLLMAVVYALAYTAVKIYILNKRKF